MRLKIAGKGLQMDEEKMEDLTPDEDTLVDEGLTGEEAHRAGEFEDLRAMLVEALDSLKAIREDLASWSMAANAAIIDNGAVVVDNDVADVVVADEPENPFTRDYYIQR